MAPPASSLHSYLMETMEEIRERVIPPSPSPSSRHQAHHRRRRHRRSTVTTVEPQPFYTTPSSSFEDEEAAIFPNHHHHSFDHNHYNHYHPSDKEEDDDLHSPKKPSYSRNRSLSPPQQHSHYLGDVPLKTTANSSSPHKQSCSSSCSSTWTAAASSAVTATTAAVLTLPHRKLVASSLSVTWRTWWLRWSLLPVHVRAGLLVALPLLGALLSVATVDLFFRQYGPSAASARNAALLQASSTTASVGIGNTQEYAVVINTYKRPAMLQQAVQHYADTCGKRVGVNHVYVVWAEMDVTPPTADSFFTTTATTATTRGAGATTNTQTTTAANRAQVTMIRAPRDSLNSRFLPIHGLATSAIFMVDDDVRVDCPSLAQGFAAWQAHPHSMVGYYPRLVSPPLAQPESTTNYIYHAWASVFWRQEFNMVLTKASFFHARYLSLYHNADHHAPQILKYVDAHKNCEDVAMALLVAHTTRQQSPGRDDTAAMPIYVQASIQDHGLLGGISTGGLASAGTFDAGQSHYDRRTRCVNDIAKLYAQQQQQQVQNVHADASKSNSASSLWVPPAVPLRDAAWLRHAPGWWWQERPSNVFEWWPQNIFQ